HRYRRGQRRRAGHGVRGASAGNPKRRPCSGGVGFPIALIRVIPFELCKYLSGTAPVIAEATAGRTQERGWRNVRECTGPCVSMWMAATLTPQHSPSGAPEQAPGKPLDRTFTPF